MNTDALPNVTPRSDQAGIGWRCLTCGSAWSGAKAHTDDECANTQAMEAETSAEPTYTLRYTMDGKPVTKAGRTAAGIEMIGTVVSRAADRGKASDIAVLNGDGE